MVYVSGMLGFLGILGQVTNDLKFFSHEQPGHSI